jgi:hypothetical protein
VTGPFEQDCEPASFIKWGNFFISWGLLVPHEDLCSVEMVSWLVGRWAGRLVSRLVGCLVS